MGPPERLLALGQEGLRAAVAEARARVDLHAIGAEKVLIVVAFTDPRHVRFFAEALRIDHTTHVAGFSASAATAIVACASSEIPTARTGHDEASESAQGSPGCAAHSGAGCAAHSGTGRSALTRAGSARRSTATARVAGAARSARRSDAA